MLDDGRLPGFVGIHESLDADFHSVCDREGLPPARLPQRPTIVGPEPTEEEWPRAAGCPDANWSERNRVLLRERHAEDFALLGRLRGAA